MERFILFIMIATVTLGVAVWISDGESNVQETSYESSYSENNTYDSYSELNTESNNETSKSNIDENQNNNDTNDIFNLSQVVDRFINEKVITVNGVDLNFKQTLKSVDINNTFGEPTNVTDLSYLNFEYSDFRISFYDDELVSVGYYNLNINEQDVVEVLGEPLYFEERNEYNQKTLGYSVYFNGEEHEDNFITLDFAFSTDGTLEYFVIN